MTDPLPLVPRRHDYHHHLHAALGQQSVNSPASPWVLHDVRKQQPLPWGAGDQHIILAGGYLGHLSYFVEALRRPNVLMNVGFYPPIVILVSEVEGAEWPQEVDFAKDEFPHVYFMQGSHLVPEDLLRAGLLSCLRIVILSEGSRRRDNLPADEDELIDYNSVLCASEAEYVFRQVRPKTPTRQALHSFGL